MVFYGIKPYLYSEFRFNSPSGQGEIIENIFLEKDHYMLMYLKLLKSVNYCTFYIVVYNHGITFLCNQILMLTLYQEQT